MLCSKKGWRCGITPAQDNACAREPICPYRKTCLPHRPTTPHLRPPKKPTRLTFPQHAACVMLKICRNGTYRDLEEWLLATDHARQALQLTRVPDHTTPLSYLRETFPTAVAAAQRRAAAASTRERDDRRCGHRRLSQRYGECVLSEPAREYAALVRAVCSGYREPVDCGDAGGAGSGFGRAVVSAVTGAGIVCGHAFSTR